MFKARIWKYLFRVVGYLVLAGGGSKQNLHTGINIYKAFFHQLAM